MTKMLSFLLFAIFCTIPPIIGSTEEFGKTCTSAQKQSSYHLIFPTSTTTSNAQLLTTVNYPMTGFTLCLRVNPSTLNLSTYSQILSYAVPNDNNEITFEILPQGHAETFIHRANIDFPEITIPTGKWTDVCLRWSLDKKAAAIHTPTENQWRTIYPTGSIEPGGTFVLGQDQDTIGGGYDPKEVFYGQLTDLHLWDYWIPDTTMREYLNCNEVEGNVINWNQLPMKLQDINAVYKRYDTKSYC